MIVLLGVLPLGKPAELTAQYPYLYSIVDNDDMKYSNRTVNDTDIYQVVQYKNEDIGPLQATPPLQNTGLLHLHILYMLALIASKQ